MSAIDLYWLPLGAGGHFVRVNGLLYEAALARVQHRERRALYHSALEVRIDGDLWVVEMAPVWVKEGGGHGVAGGAVGARWAGRLSAFRYEVRRWRGGRIPDVSEAVESPLRVARDGERSRRLLELVPQVPTPVWGRDELHTGDMWNSNSVVSWLLERSGVDTGPIHPPCGGRAPGWDAGVALARTVRGSPRP